ncbi:Glucanosyltransferase-domain-containing protein [Rhexocercosporidium sp. MPI-PUGE-AT-0058]|nr:Glucanosyltransferase-domain-containing protein [Rhexocercosporidium sp. MPI-PUGE-AT-0058]
MEILRRVNTKVDTIVIKGNYFVTKSTGARFYIRGIKFNGKTPLELSESLLNEDDCSLAIPGLLALGINVLFVILPDTTQDRSLCIEQFQAAGIYLLVIFSTASGLTQSETYWNDDQYAYQTKLIDYLSPYSNVLGYILYTASTGLQSSERTRGLAFIKARIRDVKEYMQSSNYRQIPIGLMESSSDMLESTAQYLECGNSTNEIGDFWVSVQNIECEDEILLPFEEAMQNRSETYDRFEVPLVLMDKTCSKARARNFTWVASLFGPQFSTVWSGALFDDWYSWNAGYGLVNITNNQSGSPQLSKSPAYSTLSSQIASVLASTSTESVNLPKSAGIFSCPTVDKDFRASTNLPPRPNAELCNCMMNSLSCVVPEAIPIAAVPSQISDVCDLNATYCLGIAANGTIGKYGAYSGCSLYQQYSWALNRLTINQVAHRNSTTCNFSSWGRSQTSSISASCSPLLSQAGVLGEGTVKLQSSVPTSSKPATFTHVDGSPEPSPSSLSSSGIAAVAVGAAIFMSMIIGSIILWRRKKAGKTSMANTSSEGLEVGEAPPGLGHNVELAAREEEQGRETEQWMTENAIELPDGIPPPQELSDGIISTHLTMTNSPERGRYEAVSTTDPEVEVGATTTVENIVPRKEIKRKPLASEIPSSWVGAALFDPNDPQQVLPGGGISSSDARRG